MRPVRLLSCGLLIFGLANRADAGPTYGGTYSVAASGDSVSFMFPQFDPSTGTLLSVTFAFTGATSGDSVSFENRSNVAETFEFLPYIAFGLTAPNVTVPPMAPPVPVPPFPSNTLAAFDGSPDFSGPDSVTLTLGSLTQNGKFTFGPGPPAGYVGTGMISETMTFGLAFKLAVQGGPGAANPVDRINSGTISGTFSVTYNSIPVPPSLLLSCLGLPFGFLLRRRRLVTGV
jgi:hypothetical protein